MQKKQAFASLNTHFQKYPSAFDAHNDGEVSCTMVGEFLIDHCNVDEDNAYEWAFEWANTKQ